jgi:hypothetical protein
MGKGEKENQCGQYAGARLQVRPLSEKQTKLAREGRNKHQIRVDAMFSSLSKIRIHSDITVELASS